MKEERASDYDRVETDELANDKTVLLHRQIKDLTDWWIATADSDIRTVAPKAVEYGAADLEVMGTAMQHLYPGMGQIRDLSERRAIGLEMAIAFYALGKVARLFGAFEQGRVPNLDSWYDLAIYTGMARKVRETGSWVG